MLFVTLAPCLLLFALTLRISVALRRAIVRRRALCVPKKEKELQIGKKEKKEKDDNNSIPSTKYNIFFKFYLNVLVKLVNETFYIIK